MNRIIDISAAGRIPLLTAINVFFILGILIASRINIPFFAGLAFCLLMIVAAFSARRNSFLFVLIFLLFCFGLGALHIRNYTRLPDGYSALLNWPKSQPIRIKGMIESDPVYSERKVSFIFKAKEIIRTSGSLPVSGEILVNVFDQRKFSYGDMLILEGSLYRPFNFGMAAHFSYRDYLRNQGIYSILTVKKGNEIAVAGRNKGSFLKSRAFSLKHKFKGIFEGYLWPINSRVLSGIILGERQGFPEDIRRAFIQTGTAHIIAISGFNVGIVAFIILFFLKALGIKRRARYWLTIPLLIIHMYAVGASSSVVRATIMAITMLAAYLLNRQPHIGNSLSLAALIILSYNPLQIFDAGFQLSFVSVLGIVILSPKIIGLFTLPDIKEQRSARRMPKILFKIKQKANTLLRVTLNGFSVSLSAWIVTSGFIAYYFRTISPITVLANLIIVPYTSLVIILGFSLCVSAILCPGLAALIAATTNFTLALLFKITYWLSHLPWAYFYLPARQL